MRILSLIGYLRAFNRHYNMRQFIVISGIILIAFSSCKAGKKAASKENKVPEESSVTNTYWRLSEMDGKAVENTGSDKDAYIMMASKKAQLSGFTGCNRITGSHTEGKHGAIKFEAATTRMFCANSMKTESYVLNALNKANRYVINGHHLLLYNDTYLLAIFEAKY